MTRLRSLPEGWYPSTAAGVRERCRDWERSLPPVESRFRAVVVPHAGWVFSGELAYRAIRALEQDAHTVVVAGGHLRPDDPVMLAPEPAYETPLGPLEADTGLAESIKRRLEVQDDRLPDNTVEVQLPIVRHLFPSARALYLRCPPGPQAIVLGRVVAELAIEHGETICLVGSTDLTHYGPAYGYVPAGVGPDAVRWVRDQNDRPIVDAMVGMDARETIRLGVEKRAACSSGAAAAAIAFARYLGATEGVLLEYATSYDVRPDRSFVGYAAVGYAA